MTIEKNNQPYGKLGLLATCIMLAGTACSETQKATNTSVSSDEIAAIFSDFDSSIAPGCAVGVKQNGAFVYTGGYGYADLEKKTPITIDTPFDIASVSKQFTAMSVMLLEQRGLISLDDSIRKYVPELAEYTDKIKLRHMIHHMSGLSNYTGLLPFAGIGVYDPADGQTVIDLLNRIEAPNGPPGKYFDYNNTAFFLLTEVVARVTGGSFDDFAKKNIFEPLGMHNTGFVGNYVHEDQRAEGYERDDKGALVAGTSPWLPRGAGQIVTTVADFAKWDENFYTGKVGGKELVAAMVEPGELDNGQKLDYAGGLFISEYKGQKLIRHSGGWIGFRTMYGRLPDLHTSAIVFCNTDDASPSKYASQLLDLYMKDHVAADAEQPSVNAAFAALGESADASSMPEGLYREVWKGGYIRLVASEGGLALQTNLQGGETLPLTRAGQVYKAVDDDDREDFVFLSAGERGGPAKVIVPSSGVTEAYVYVPSWSPENLDDYLGSYRNTVFGVDYAIEKGGDGLFLVTDEDRLPLTPTGVNEFQAGRWMSIRFPEEKGKTDSFKLATYHTLNLSFEKQYGD